MNIDRRRLLAGFGVGAAASAAGRASAHGDHAMGSFLHGVASGDPLQDRLIVWTRLTPHEGHGLEDIEGELRVWTNAKLTGAVKIVKVAATADRDWTVKVDLDGLKPGADYFYQFRFGASVSPVGRGRTLPEGRTEDVVLAVASCALFVQGYFNAYGAIAAMDRVDAVLHLGDYIYEYGADQYGAGSPAAKARKLDPPTEILTLADYRRRHACYKADPNLQAAHARAPWIVVWDDHETANDSWVSGAENHNDGEGDWASRKAVALKAYFEWMPIREAKGAMSDAIYRSFRFGDLATLLMTETRLTARTEPLDAGRDLMVDGKPDIPGFMQKLNDPARRLMDERQHAWLSGELDRSVKAGETWQVIGNQVVMAKVLAPNLHKAMGDEAWNKMLSEVPDYVAKAVAAASMLSATPIPVNLDQWDGYPADRERVFQSFKAAKARPIVLAGDSHSFWANELSDASGTLVAAEFGTTGITSPGFADMLPGAPLNEALVARNPEVKFTDSAAKGFVKLTLSRTKAVAEMIAVSTIYAPEYEVKSLKTFTVTPEGTGVSRLA